MGLNLLIHFHGDKAFGPLDMEGTGNGREGGTKLVCHDQEVLEDVVPLQRTKVDPTDGPTSVVLYRMCFFQSFVVLNLDCLIGGYMSSGACGLLKRGKACF